MGIRLLKRAAVLAAALAGCYQPSVDPCTYRCNGQACPNDLVCTNDNWCAAAKSDQCSGLSGDGGIVDARPDASCGWNVTNFDACAAGIHLFDGEQDWNIPAGTTVAIDTDTAVITAAAAFPAGGYKMLKVQPGGGAAQTLVLGVHDLVVSGPINVTGANPLLIVASGTVTIGAAIHLDPTSDGTGPCNGGNGGGGSGGVTGGGGGAGGAFGGAGGAGGTGSTTTAAAGEAGGMTGMVSGSDLVPLRGGCTGGRGGTWVNPNIAGGIGGKGGNAIEISARVTILFVPGGTIIANGENGRATSASRPAKAGGGGGGSGGGILLEAPTINVSNARLCAFGGGGGASFANSPGTTASTCTVTAPGGGTAGGFASGGAGAANTMTAVAGSPGMTNTPEGGGGGGGGFGKIRAIGTTTGTPTSVSPPFEQ